LDEFTYLLMFKMVDLEPVMETLAARPKDLHVVVTGRGAPPALIEAADLVTEMRPVKHPLKEGIKARMGIEF
jgi:cob(I)alamin adenosyltransferase